MANRWGNNGNSDRLFSWAPKSPWMVTAAMKLKTLASQKKKDDKTVLSCSVMSDSLQPHGL